MMGQAQSFGAFPLTGHARARSDLELLEHAAEVSAERRKADLQLGTDDFIRCLARPNQVANVPFAPDRAVFFVAGVIVIGADAETVSACPPQLRPSSPR